MTTSRNSHALASPNICAKGDVIRGTPGHFTAFAMVVKNEGVAMLSWALTFLVIAIIAAIFGFGGIASTAAGIAQILFVVFLALFLISLIVGIARGRPPA